MTPTEKAVAQLRAYAKYMDENAEDIIGSLDLAMTEVDSRACGLATEAVILSTARRGI